MKIFPQLVEKHCYSSPFSIELKYLLKIIITYLCVTHVIESEIKKRIQVHVFGQPDSFLCWWVLWLVGSAFFTGHIFVRCFNISYFSWVSYNNFLSLYLCIQDVFLWPDTTEAKKYRSELVSKRWSKVLLRSRVMISWFYRKRLTGSPDTSRHNGLFHDSTDAHRIFHFLLPLTDL